MLSSMNYESQIQDTLQKEKIIFDTIKLRNHEGNQYIKPVVTKMCYHLKECFELDEIKKQLETNQLFTCAECSQKAQQYSDLMWDIRYYANQEFHDSVDEIHIILGLMVNKYQRNKKYLDLLTIEDVKGHFVALIQQNFETNSFLKSLIDKKQSGQQELYAICLLDFVKIIIPVRIYGCQHLECYEFTSLLYYQQNKKQSENSFRCTYPECNQKLDISSLNSFFYGIFIDQLLLKEIKQKNPVTIIFNINKSTKTFEQKIYFPLNQSLISYSQKFNKQMTKQQELDISTNLDKVILQIIQTNLLLEKQDLKSSLLESTSELYIIDQFTKLHVELPTRCINCKDLNKSIDLLTYIFDFLYQKLMNNQQKYSCPLCNSPQNQIMAIINLNKYIYIDQFLLLKLIKSKNDKYEQQNLNILSQNLQQSNNVGNQLISNQYLNSTENSQQISSTIIYQTLKDMIYDTLSLGISYNAKFRYRNPALTKRCIHYNSCFEMEEALKDIQQNKFYQCPHCYQQAKSPADLVEDWRVQAYKEFNIIVENVTIIKGIVVNKYIRNKKKYLDFFLIEECARQFLKMFERVSYDTSIYSMIQKELVSQKSNNQTIINFWCFCLLDKVKINVPVRIQGCKHYECYELTSLLFFQEQNRKKQEFLNCNQPGCSNRLKIAHIDYTKQPDTLKTPQTEEQDKINDIITLFSGICVDLDLLNAIKLSNPYPLKFYYNQDTGKIQEDVIIENGKYVDPVIKAVYYQHPDFHIKTTFEEFQKQIQQQAMSVSQGDLLQDDKQLGKKISLYKYRNYKVKMQDQLTKLTIEYPVRCKLCTDLQVCMDMRSYIADFNYQKKVNPTKIYSCPLCKKPQNKSMIQTQIQNYIYLDTNMLSYMFKDMSYTNGTNIFEYQGEQYMLQEFMDRYKIKREDYIKELNERQVVFKQLFCAVNFDLRIKLPLLLQNCLEKHIVDFKSFYEELKKIDFDYEQQGLILCKCVHCYRNPIKSFVGNIYFHEPFYEALNKFYKIQNPVNDKEFTYKFADNEQDSMVVVGYIVSSNPKIKVVQKLETDYNPIDKDDIYYDWKYQQLFQRRDISGFFFNLKIMQIYIGIFSVYLEKDKIYVDLQSARKFINSNISLQLKQYSFQITKIVLQLKSDTIFGFLSRNYIFTSDE
ncbi:unnamed protein product [Paramecium primaurelia]|uniref:SP-RING-type domain-containing protein n=1 Tax=Paramecium primaurelia TaxID=5886 RepID=A0A8S1Q0K7_PARPR|nr:unnamed protein product [Paramecium primaurelia]